ncbi:hypothetical protein [Homoserinibacter sp. GY 40078]|uniref:hypothetical protein n=1 Tax=Homoserinibacter sp. GY 40078 TaxID=2603275 RepID=UPI0011CCB024|nr:hypothetical protein [Homoserinibacter sp. GY 40078]TXK18452.1 hypothetical protein FVQ89_00345 [Homoserinibacter sp. GY 40078]
MAQQATDAARLATEAANIATQEAQTARADLSTRITEIDKQVAERRSQKATEQAETFDSIGEEVSRESILKALAAAAEIEAIQRLDQGMGGATHSLIVRAGETFGAPLVRVLYTSGWNVFGNNPGSLDLAFVPKDMELRRSYARAYAITWDHETSPVEAVQRLQKVMVRAGYGWLSKQFSAAALFRNLQVALREAVAAREGDSLTILSGDPVGEMVSPDCFVTTGGVEFVEAWVKVGAQKFEYVDPSEGRILSDLPEPSEDVGAVLWDVAIQRGQMHFNGQTDTTF